MRNAILAIGLFLCTSAAHAQSLAIGGIEVRIGDTATVAMDNLRQKLSSEFTVGRVHTLLQTGLLDTVSTWYVVKREVGRRIDVATVSVQDGLISALVKFYDTRDGNDVADAYSAAMMEAQRQSRERCTTTPPPVSGDRIWTITTTCGRYAVVLNLSWRNQSGPGTNPMSVAVLVNPLRPSRR